MAAVLTMEAPSSPLSSPPPSSPNLSSKARRTNAEKIKLVTQYLTNELYWSLGDFFRAVATDSGPFNIRRRDSLVEVVYEDPMVLAACLGVKRPIKSKQREARSKLIQFLDIGGIELRDEIINLA